MLLEGVEQSYVSSIDFLLRGAYHVDLDVADQAATIAELLFLVAVVDLSAVIATVFLAVSADKWSIE